MRAALLVVARVFSVAGLLLTFANPTHAQTAVSSGQMGCQFSGGTGAPQMLIAIPVGQLSGIVIVHVQCVALDPASFVIDRTTTPWTIRAIQGTTTSSINFVDAEIPTGAINGTNLVFTLAGTPNPPASLRIERNGLGQNAGIDYVLSGNTITFLSVATPGATDTLKAWYRK